MTKRDRPLKILEFFLRNVIPYEDQENLAGDFKEMFEWISGKSGKSRALVYLPDYQTDSLIFEKSHLLESKHD